MRIVCDHCSRTITGTVKREAGNLNLHPDCPGRLDKPALPESTAVSRLSHESLANALVLKEGKRTGDSSKMK